MKRALAGIGIAAVSTLAIAAGLRTLERSRTFQLFSRPVARVATKDSVVALTFDDGPTEASADTLIRILQSRGVFVVGQGVASAPRAARALIDSGHELGRYQMTRVGALLGHDMKTLVR